MEYYIYYKRIYNIQKYINIILFVFDKIKKIPNKVEWFLIRMLEIDNIDYRTFNFFWFMILLFKIVDIIDIVNIENYLQ